MYVVRIVRYALDIIAIIFDYIMVELVASEYICYSELKICSIISGEREVCLDNWKATYKVHEN